MSLRSFRRLLLGRFAPPLLAAAALGGCELTEVSLAEPADVVVVEGYVAVSGSGSGGGLARVFLHRSIGDGGASTPVPGAVVRVIREARGDTLPLEESEVAPCAASTPVLADGTCYLGASTPFQAGELLRLEVELPGGGRVVGATRIPGAFGVAGLPSGDEPCALPADVPLELVWGRAGGAWAYVAEAVVRGLPDALAARGIAFEDEALNLLGISVSAADTTIVFPAELGVFARGDLDREVALALQRGLPDGASAEVTVAAVDRNWVNWLRGGNFNPSGQVRIPSVAGDATGWFGSAVVHGLEVVTPGAAGGGGALPPCPGS